MFEFLKKSKKEKKVPTVPELSKKRKDSYMEIFTAIFPPLTEIQKMGVEKVLESAHRSGCMAGAIEITELFLGSVPHDEKNPLVQELRSTIKKVRE